MSKKEAQEWTKKGDTLAQEGQLGPAEQAYRNALGINPEAKRDQAQLVRVLSKQTKFKEAQELMKAISPAHPRTADLRSHLADSLSRNGRAQEAVEELKAAIAAQPSAKRYWRLSQILRTQKRRSEAIAAIEDALRLDAENPRFHEALRKLRDLEERSRLPKVRKIGRAPTQPDQRAVAESAPPGSGGTPFPPTADSGSSAGTGTPEVEKPGGLFSRLLGKGKVGRN